MHKIIGVMCALMVANVAQSESPISPVLTSERFSGEASLSPQRTRTSTNSRFAISAELQAALPTPNSTTNGRFTVRAELTAPKSLATTCGPTLDSIFKNGFEN